MAYLLISMLTVLLLALYLRQQTLQQQVYRLKERLDSLADITGHVEYRSDYIGEKLQNELKRLKKSGQPVQAVKHLREQTGMNLVQAKQFVDKL